MLQCHQPERGLAGEELEKAVDLFLALLRTYNMEATLCLDALLESVWSELCTRDCVGCLCGVLAAVYLLYFC